MQQIPRFSQYLAALPVAAASHLNASVKLQAEEPPPSRLTKYTRSPDYPPREQEIDFKKLHLWFKDHFEAVLPKSSDPAMTPRERQLYRMSASEYIEARRQGGVTCKEYAVAVVKRARYYRYLNQWIYNCYDRFDQMIAQAQAMDDKAAAEGVESIGPFFGLPIPMKGTAAVVDYPSGSGVGVLSGYVPKKDSDLTLRIKAANGLIFGCTNVPEFAAGYNTTNPASGTTRNVYGHHLTVGGSSGGAASAVAAYMCPLAVTEDTGGSTRVPALCNNNFGFDPSRNHYCNDGNPGLTYTNDQLGVNARSMEDIILYDSVLLPELKGAHEEARLKASLRTAASIHVVTPMLPFVHELVGPGLDGAGVQRTVNAEMREKYEAVKTALSGAGFSVLEREWPSAYFDYLGRSENICVECCNTKRPVNGEPISHAFGGLRSMSGQAAAWVLDYLDAPVSLKEIKEDMTCFGGQPRGFWDLPTAMSETAFRYWMGPKIKSDCEVYNRLFDETGADFMLIPAANSATPDVTATICETVPLTHLPGSRFGEGIKEIGSAFGVFGQHNFRFKHLHIPKLSVPTGLSPDGRPTAVQLWGRAVPYDQMFDDAYSAKHDVEFLHLVGRLVDTIQAQPSLRRKDADMIVKDLHLGEQPAAGPSSRL